MTWWCLQYTMARFLHSPLCLRTSHTQQIKMCVYLANIAQTHQMYTRSIHIHKMINEYSLLLVLVLVLLLLLIPYIDVFWTPWYFFHELHIYIYMCECFPSVSFSHSKINLDDFINKLVWLIYLWLIVVVFVIHI